jgi:programmed cell death protein 5
MQQEINELQLEILKKEILRKVLTKDALERLGRIKLVNPALASQLELYLVQLYQAGQITEKINDEMLKKILQTLTGKRRESRIRIIRK